MRKLEEQQNKNDQDVDVETAYQKTIQVQEETQTDDAKSLLESKDKY